MNKKSHMVFLISIGGVVSLITLLGLKGYVDLSAVFRSESVVGLGYVFAYGIGALVTGGVLVGLLKYEISKRIIKDEK